MSIASSSVERGPGGLPRDYAAEIRRLAPRFAARAAKADRGGEYVHETIADLIRSGYTSATVKRKYGGGEASLEELCRAQETLASACASSAFILNMHLHGVGMLNLLEGNQLDWAFEAIVRDGALIAGGFSEPGVGGNWWYPTTVARRAPGGYVLSGRKGFFTGFPSARLLFLTAALKNDRGLSDGVGFLVPTPLEGVRVERPWDACGMRATGSHSLVLEDVAVDERYLVGKPGDLPMLFMKAVRWAWCSFSSCFVGIACAALDHVTRSMVERRIAVLDKPLAHLPGVQFHVAEMRMRLESARSLLYQVARQDKGLDPDPIQTYTDVSLMKRTICALCAEVVSLAMRTVGGSAYVASNPVQQMMRDVAAGPLLPPAGDLVLEWAGKLALGVPVLAEPRWGE
ncbi:MAG: acyl-CoA/acyl-ACP dehydrogenase [Myxococcales bacterium]|nr:acyl-CoA/acyl-ACP dehydrogenase [Myxococcales bacterium]